MKTFLFYCRSARLEQYTRKGQLPKRVLASHPRFPPPLTMRTPSVFSCRRRSLKLLGALGSAAVAVLSGPIHAQNVDWDAGAGNGLWTDASNWIFDLLPGETDTALFSLNAVSTVSLNGTNQKVAGISFTTGSAYTIVEGSTGGSLTLNSISHTGNVNNAIQVPISTFNPATDVLTVNSTANQLQLQRKITSAGLIKTGGNNVRLGTSSTNFDNAINGDIVINGGSLTASAAGTAGVNNPLGGTGSVVIGASGVTLNLQAQTNYEFLRPVVANNNSFTFTAAPSTGDPGDFQLTIGKISIGNATLTATASSGYQTRTSELAINSGTTSTINTPNSGQHLLVNKLSGDSTTKIVKTGAADLRILGNADNASSFSGDFDLNGGWFVLEALNGNQPLGHADTQIKVVGNNNSTISLRAADTFTFQNINVDAGNNSFNYDFRRLSGSNTNKVLTGGTVTIGNATMNVTGENGFQGRLAGFFVNSGATAIVNVNSNAGGAPQHLRLDALTGDATTTFQKNGGQTLWLTAGNTTNFTGKLNLNGGTTQIEWTDGETPTLNLGGITVLSGSNLNLRANGNVDLGTNASLTFGPGVISANIDINRLSGSSTSGTIGMGGTNISGKTLRVAGGNGRTLALTELQVDAGATGVLNTDGGNVSVAQLITGAGSTLNKPGGSTLTLTSDNSATSSAPINVYAGTLVTNVPGGFGTGLITVGDTRPGVTGSPGSLTSANAASRVRYGAVGASANTTGADVVAVAGGVIDLDVVPTFDDVFEVRADGRIQGDASQLAGLKVGTNLTLAPDAIVTHDNPSDFSPVQGIETVAEKSIFYGISANATLLPTIGAGTPWKGISIDNTARTVQTVLPVNGGDNDPSTVEFTLQGMFDQVMNLGTTAGGDASFSFATTGINGEKVTLAIRGTLGTSGLGNVPGGRVAFNQSAAESNINNVVDKIIVQGGSLLLMTASPLGGVPVEVLNGGSVDINNAASVFIDGNLTVKNGGVLYLNDNQVLGVAGATNHGTVTIETGGKLDISGSAPANIFTGSAANNQPITFTGTGHTVRFAASDIAGLDSTVPNQGVTYVVAGSGTAATVAGTNINVGTNTQAAGITLENGILTNDGSSRAFSGPITLNNTNLTVAATRGTDLVVTSAISTTGNVQIGSATPIDNRNKSLNYEAVNWAGVPDPYNSQTRVVFTDAFAANNVTVHNTHLGFANANTSITGDLTVNGSVLYLDGGGPISGTQGELTAKLAAGTVANKIIIGNYSRTEMRLDMAQAVTNPASGVRELDVNQAFVIAGDVNPLDRRSFWISRSETSASRVNLNNVTLNEGAVFGVQEDGTDVRASLKLAGNAISMGNAAIDYTNISRDASLPAFNGSNPVVLQQGRLNVFGTAGENNQNSTVYGKIDAGVQIDLIRGQIFLAPSAVLDGVIRAHTAPAGGDAFVVSTSNNGSNTFTTDTIGGTGSGRIEIGRSGAASGPEDFEIRGTEVTNAAAAQAPLHTHVGEVRVIDDGTSAIDAIVRSNRQNDSDRTARVQLNNLQLTAGSTVQLQSSNGVPLTVDTITLQGAGTIDTANAGMTINTIAAGTHPISFTGAVSPTIVNPMTAGPVSITGSANFLDSVTAPQVSVNGGTATFNGNVNSAVTVERGLATVNGDVSNGLTVNVGGLAAFDAGFGTRTITGPVTLDVGGLGVTNGTLDLGNTVIAGTAGTQYLAGLREARVSGAFNESTPSAGGVVKLGPVMAQSTTGWGTNETYIYTGQFFVPDNNGDGTGSFAFAENFDDSVRIDIDGGTVLRNTTWNDAVGTGMITLAAGWHEIEFRLGQGGGGAGPNNSEGWNTSLGVGIDLTLPIDPAAGPNPSANPTMANFVAPLDNGSMNLFRTAVSSALNVGADSTLRAGGMTNVEQVNFSGFNANVRIEGTGAAVASSAGTLAVSGSASGVLEIVRPGDSLTASALSLGGNFLKSGPGTLQMTGATTGTGDIVVAEGALLLGNHASSTTGSVSVEADGNLGGSLEIGGLLTMDGGTLTMTLAGLTAGTEYSKLSVLGGVSLTDDVELSLQLAFNPADNGTQAFTIIENFGPGTVTDAGFFFTNGGVPLKEGDIFTAGAGGFQGFQISYTGGDGNDVVLTAVPEPGTAVSLFGGLGLLLGMQRMRRRRK